MNFDKAYITDEGATILAASLNNEYTIQWGNVYTTNVDLSTSTEEDIHELTLADFPQSTYTSSGTVQNILVDRATNIANVYSEINNASFNGTAKSFIVLAKFPSDQNYSLVMVAYCDQATPTIVPSNTEPFIAHVNFNVEVSDHSVSTVTSASGWYASNDAFQNLANRVVTTHSLNDSTTGENQNILGNKTFKNNLIATSILPETHSTSISVGNDIGSDSNRFRYAYIRGVNAADVEAYKITSTNLFTSNGLAYFNSETRCTTDFVVDGEIDAGTITCYGDLTVNLNITVGGDILPEQSNYSNLGSSLKTWDCIYTREAYVKDKLRIVEYSNTYSDICGIQFMSDYQSNKAYITVSGNTDYEDGSYSDLEFKFVVSPTSNTHDYFIIATSYTISGDIVTYPSVNGKWDLGKVSGNNSYKLNRVYANEFIGQASTANGLKYTSSSTGNVIYASNNTTVIPNGNSIKLGDSTHKFNEIHSDKLFGSIPTTELNYQSRPVIQVGCIFLGIVHKNTSGQDGLSVGTEIEPYLGTYDIYVAEYNNSNGYWGRYGYGITSTSGAKYKLLNALYISANGNAGMSHAGDALALMMRIS